MSVSDGPYRSDMQALREAEAWVFDLDNTLYPASCNLFAAIDERMRGYVAAFLGLDLDAAFAVQKQYFREYGTSLRGLMHRHGMEPEPFLEHVHDIDLTVLDPAPILDQALAALPGRKFVFTNASSRHAERVIARLGIDHHFEGVFDIAAARYAPKPEPAPYGTLVRQFGVNAGAAVMVEDMARNLAPAAALGMTTVWVRTGSDVGREGSDEGHVHHVCDDLTVWLQQVVGGAA